MGEKEKKKELTGEDLRAFEEKCAQPGYPGTMEERLAKRQAIIDAKTKQAKMQLALKKSAEEERKKKVLVVQDRQKKILRKEIEAEIRKEIEAEAKETPE
jgi:hypothetical protein